MNPTDYSKLAAPYSVHRRAHPGVVWHLAAELGAGAQVLEVGCGTGNYLAALFESTGCHCVGIDPSAHMLAKLRERDLPPDRVEAIQASAEEPNRFRDRFDLIYSVDVIHHLRDRRAAFRSAFQALKAGGRLCTATDSEWVIRHRRPLSTYFPETVGIELARYPPILVLRSEMTSAGFSALHEEVTEHRHQLTDAGAYRAKVFSSLLHISDAAFESGLARLESDLARGPVEAVSRYLLLWGTKA